MKQQLDTFLLKQPAFGKGVNITQGAVVLGDVTLGDIDAFAKGRLLEQERVELLFHQQPPAEAV